MNKDQIIANKLILQANSQTKEIERLKAEIKELKQHLYKKDNLKNEDLKK